MMNKIYPRKGDTQTVYLNAVVKDPSIEIGDYTIYNDFVSDPRQFEQNNVLYHYPINHERLIIDRKSTRLNSSHSRKYRMPSSA